MIRTTQTREHGAFTVAALAVVLAAIGCGPKSIFALSADENNRTALEAALAHRKIPAQPSPVNASHQPRVFAVAAGGKPKSIIAYDLAADHLLWQADADVQSRIFVGGDFIVELEGKSTIVARDQQRGAKRWSVDLPGEFVGVSADAERAYVVAKDGADWLLAAYDGASGKRLWKVGSSGKLGAPAGQGGVVYVPFFDQWLALLDGQTGTALTRIRGVDEGIAMVRATSDVVFYGNKQGIFRLDPRSAYGTRAKAAYTQAIVPPQLDRTFYGRDAYDVTQQTYSAFDRTEILYAAPPGTGAETGPLRLAGDGYAVAYFRYIFGFHANGDLAWTYANPRTELVASEDTGAAILAVSISGDLVAIDPATGGLRARKSLGTTSQILGATFDADGWSPPGQGETVETVEALVSIARDRDARFDRVKDYAVTQLAKLPGAQITTELLGILADPRAPVHLKNTVVELLVARHDPASLPVLAQQLAMRADYIAKTDTDALLPIARVVAGFAGEGGAASLDPQAALPVYTQLVYHLGAAQTQPGELVAVIGALHAIGGGKEYPLLASHLLLYRADDELGNDPAWGQAIARALADGGPAERELLQQVVTDPRTKPPLVSAIREAAGTLLRP